MNGVLVVEREKLNVEGLLATGVYKKTSNGQIILLVRLYNDYNDKFDDPDGVKARYSFIIADSFETYRTHTYDSAVDAIKDENLVRITDAQLVV